MEYLVLSGLVSKLGEIDNNLDCEGALPNNVIKTDSIGFHSHSNITKSEQLFTNAQLVLMDEVISGSIQVVDGIVTDISSGPLSSRVSALDCSGNYLLPGLIELHTDHLETHYSPRPNVRWDKLASVQAHDAQIAAAGITTVYDCLRCGQESNTHRFSEGEILSLAETIRLASRHNRLRVEHRLHLRCELSAEDVLDDFHQFDHLSEVGLVSLMDHAPGQRQFVTLDSYAQYHQARLNMSDEEFSDYVDRRISDSKTYSVEHRQKISAICRERGIPIASHDDATQAHVNESVSCGVGIAEFPTTMDAAKKSHASGLGVLMGAPNVVRGGSHSGNVGARHLLHW